MNHDGAVHVESRRRHHGDGGWLVCSAANTGLAL